MKAYNYKVAADEAVDQFIDRLMTRLRYLGYDTTNCDGDDDPAVILADWMHGQKWPVGRVATAGEILGTIKMADSLKRLSHLGINASIILSSATENIENRIMADQVEELGLSLGREARKASDLLAKLREPTP